MNKLLALQRKSFYLDVCCFVVTVEVVSRSQFLNITDSLIKIFKIQNSHPDVIDALKLGRLVLMKDALELIPAGQIWPITVQKERPVCCAVLAKKNTHSLYLSEFNIR